MLYLYLIALLSLSSCQFLSKKERITLPEEDRQSFDECKNSDGAISGMLYRGKDLILSLNLDWIAQAGTWDWELQDALGQSLGHIAYKNHPAQGAPFTFELKHKLAPLNDSLSSKVKVRKDEYLETDGFFIGIKGSELACLFSDKFPASWLPDAYRCEGTYESKTCYFYSDPRTIEVSFSRRKNGTLHKVCSLISWTSFLGLRRHQAQWCKNLKEETGLFTDGSGNYKVEWQKVNEQ